VDLSAAEATRIVPALEDQEPRRTFHLKMINLLLTMCSDRQLVATHGNGFRLFEPFRG
jgi:hypothetical protein